MKKPRIARNETWNMNFQFHLGWSAKEFEAFLRKTLSGFDENFHRAAGHTRLVSDSDGRVSILIWVAKPKDYSTLAHEAVHAAGMTLSDRGVHASWSNDEPLAYLVSWIVEKALGKKSLGRKGEG